MFHRVRFVLIACLIAAFLPCVDRACGAALSDDQQDRRNLRRTPVVDVFERNRDSVVNIASTQIVESRSPFGFDSLFDELFEMPSPFRPRRYARTSMGSGFVLHPDGYIITNAHVVARTVERKVIFADDREFDAEIVALDTERDLAMLKIESPDPLPAITLGRSDDLMVGETVIAIGNPLGYQHTVTAGVVSATDRDLEFRGGLTLKGLIQTDASINPGNSGGPLLNILGELIGVNTAIRGDAQNIGFAIAVDQLRDVLPDLLDIERRYRVEVGMDVDTRDVPRVVRVEIGSPADQAGVQTGDVLREVDGRPIRRAHGGLDFYIALIGRKAGDDVPLSLDRDGETVQTTMRLAERPIPRGDELAWQRLGLRMREITREEADEIGMSDLAGMVVITDVQRDGPAHAQGFSAGEVVIAVNRHGVDSLERLGQLLEVVRRNEVISVTVLRITVARNVRQMHQVRRQIQVR